MAGAKKTGNINVNFSVDLESQAINQLNFLKQVDSVEELKKPSVLARSLYRYEKFWLPLAAAHSKDCLSAPLDIEWVWHCHMLSPRAYVADCKQITDTVVNHILRSTSDYNTAVKNSESLWQKEYPSEPFHMDYNARYDVSEIDNFKSRITYDVIAAASRQTIFYYQVSLPHYRDQKYLQGALQRYKKFLFLKKQLEQAFLVPCYDIDLIWHTHQLNPWAYKKDMVDIIGNLFNHDDTVNDRSEGSKLYNADMETREHWKTFYDESFSLSGAMYRGNPPAGFLYQITDNDVNSFATKKTEVQVEGLSLHLGSNNFDKIELKLGASAGGKRTDTTFFTLKRPQGTVSRHPDIVWSQQELQQWQFTFDTRHHNNLSFELHEKHGFACCISKQKVGDANFNFLPVVESAIWGGNFNIQAPFSHQRHMDMSGRFTAPRRGAALLFLDQGKYESAIVPESVQSLWGPVALERLPRGTDNHCQIASHRLKNHIGNVMFTCRTIHSQPLMMSVIQVYFHNEMAAIGHLIASDQLPLPTQVLSMANTVTLNPRAGERAILIKNNTGDWGIVTGKWVGLKKGTAGVPGTKYERGTKGVPGSPGTLSIRFYKMKTEHYQRQDLGYLNNNFLFEMESAKVDLMKGVVEFEASTSLF